ncbi:MAG: SDR family NAD(P)-dependent oxidoreductase, partial [Acetobacteraceae bacterium]
MNRYDMDGQVAVVTGGAQGIGLAVARRLADSGARVAIWDIDGQLVERSAADIGRGAIALAVDVTSLEAVAEATGRTQAMLGRIDALVTSAGIAGMNATVIDYPVAEWERVIAINLTGTFFCCKSVLPLMVAQGYGRVVLIASVAGKEGNPNAS